MSPRRTRHRRSRRPSWTIGHRTTARDSPEHRLFRIRYVIAGSLVACALFAVGVTALAVFALSDGGAPGPPRAVIVDQLADTDPNEDFVRRAMDMLEGAGFETEYVRHDSVTVDLYRHLPKRNYDLVILRTHSAAMRVDVVGIPVGGQLVPALYRNTDVAIFTNEGFTFDAHVDDLRHERLTYTYYDEISEPEDALFGITPDFIADGIEGRFKGSTVVLMGCGGLASTSMAEAFVSRGARDFVSWDGLVSASHTDRATERLLELMLVEGRSAANATAITMEEVGPDPFYEAQLLYYDATAD
jgi:hypothetical protein